MKKFLVLSILCLLFKGYCFGQSEFTLSGNFLDSNHSDTVYIKQPVNREVGRVLYKIPVHSNNFIIKGKVDSTIIAVLEYSSGNDINRKSFILQNGNINFTINKYDALVSGTDLNDSLQAIVKQRDIFSEAWDKADETYESATLKEKVKLNNEVIKWKDATQNYTVSAIRRNINNLLGILLLFEYTKFTPADQLKDIVSIIPDKYKNNPYVLKQDEFLNGIEKTKEGQHYLDFELPDTDGKLIKISNIIARNKYTVIDFWASWCVPCCHEMPELIKLYNTYKSRGLGVVGISWDRDRSSWLNGINRLKIPWIQLSDIKGRENIVGRLYGVRTIPSIWIIDQKGIIVARWLRGDDVPKVINGLFASASADLK